MPTSISELKERADRGDPEAQYAIGRLFFDGDEVEKDFREAALWFLKAAKQGNPSAQYALAVQYLDGLGIPKDEDKGLLWLEKASEQGHVQAGERLSTLRTVEPEPDCQMVRIPPIPRKVTSIVVRRATAAAGEQFNGDDFILTFTVDFEGHTYDGAFRTNRGGTLVEWLVSPDQPIGEGDPILRLRQGDRVDTIEFSPFELQTLAVHEIYVAEGDYVSVGQPVTRLLALDCPLGDESRARYGLRPKILSTVAGRVSSLLIAEFDYLEFSDGLIEVELPPASLSADPFRYLLTEFSAGDAAARAALATAGANFAWTKDQLEVVDQAIHACSGYPIDKLLQLRDDVAGIWYHEFAGPRFEPPWGEHFLETNSTCILQKSGSFSLSSRTSRTRDNKAAQQSARARSQTFSRQAVQLQELGFGALAADSMRIAGNVDRHILALRREAYPKTVRSELSGLWMLDGPRKLLVVLSPESAEEFNYEKGFKKYEFRVEPGIRLRLGDDEYKHDDLL